MCDVCGCMYVQSVLCKYEICSTSIISFVWMHEYNVSHDMKIGESDSRSKGCMFISCKDHQCCICL